MTQLEAALEPARLQEMDRYGRTSIYKRMEDALDDKNRRILRLVNHGLTMVDDIIDNSDEPLTYLAQMQELLGRTYSGQTLTSESPVEEAITGLGTELHGMAQSFWTRGKARVLYSLVLDYWKTEVTNFQRRERILPRAGLDPITKDIGSIIAMQFMMILDPPTDPFEFINLCNAYGMAVKLADNLCDYREDINAGFVNVPKEDIHHVTGLRIEGDRILEVENSRLSLSRAYIEKEYGHIRDIFGNAEHRLLLVRAQRPLWDRRLHQRLKAFGDLCQAWHRQAKEFVASETKIAF